MDWEASWQWFLNFGEFYVVIFGPPIIAALPLLILEGIMMGLFLLFVSATKSGD